MTCKKRISLNKDPYPKILINISRVKNSDERIRLLNQIASAQYYCTKLFINLVIHPEYLKISNSGIMLYGVESNLPDERYLPIDIYSCNRRLSSWAIGCVLYTMITGESLVKKVNTRDNDIIKYLGSPSMRECYSLKISYLYSMKKKYRRNLKRATFVEQNILTKCLSWLPSCYMICEKKGLSYVIDSIEEEQE
jgi:hypothetical protein